MIGKIEELKDPIIARVIDKIASRSEVGYKKYGVTLQDDCQPLKKWLIHMQEELMDAVNYAEKAIAKLEEIEARDLDVKEYKKDTILPIKYTFKRDRGPH